MQNKLIIRSKHMIFCEQKFSFLVKMLRIDTTINERFHETEVDVNFSFTLCDMNRLRRVCHYYGEVLVLSITLVLGKTCTSAVIRCRTKDAAAAAEGTFLRAIQANDLRITLMVGGYPLFVNGKIAGAISAGGETESQSCAITKYMVSVFKALI